MYKELIALGLMNQVGAVKIKKMVGFAGSIEQIFLFSFKELCEIPGIGQQAAAQIRGFTEWDKVDHILKVSENQGYKMLSILDENYPLILSELYDAPPILWYVGDVTQLKQKNIAVVGTRKMSDYAAKETIRFTKALVEQGLNIVSGLALGVDTLAHRICMEYGGKTIAVLGSGFNKIYPAINKTLARKIVENGGCLISEYDPLTKAEAAYFPTRNRIVSGLSVGVVLIESGMKGGSMITAARALDQNREVFAIPHPNGTINGEGGNHLIKKSAAKLIQIPEDIFEEIGINAANSCSERKTQDGIGTKIVLAWLQKDKEQAFNEHERSILSLCSSDKQSVDQLLETSELPFNRLQEVLFDLELNGYLEQLPGAYFKSL